jgi:hypothetical protein
MKSLHMAARDYVALAVMAVFTAVLILSNVFVTATI